MADEQTLSDVLALHGFMRFARWSAGADATAVLYTEPHGQSIIVIHYASGDAEVFAGRTAETSTVPLAEQLKAIGEYLGLKRAVADESYEAKFRRWREADMAELSKHAQQLLEVIRECDGAEVHACDDASLDELVAAGLIDVFGARGPSGAWRRAQLRPVEPPVDEQLARIVAKLERLAAHRDPEVAHATADDLLVEALRLCAPADVADKLVAAYEAVPKWYA